MGYRRGAMFVAHWRQHSRQLDRNERARIIALAEGLERRTKAKGSRNGALGYVGLQILRTLIFGFLGKSGLLSPSYDALQKATGLCRQSIANGLKRLELAGIVRIVRRICRQRVGSIIRTTQATNLYSIWRPIAESTEKGETTLQKQPIEKTAVIAVPTSDYRRSQMFQGCNKK